MIKNYLLKCKQVADLQLKNADISRTHELCRMVYIFFGSSLGKLLVLHFIIKGYV